MPNKKLTHLDIRTRLLVLCLAVAMPLLCISAYSIWKQYKSLRNEAKQATTFEAAIAVRALSRWLETQEGGLSALADLPEIKALDLSEARKTLVKVAQAQPDWHSVALVDKNGQPLASNSQDNPFTAAELRGEKFFQDIVAGGRPAISGYMVCPQSGRPAILVGAPVGSAGSVKAAVVACVYPSAVLGLFRGLGQENGSVIAVVDQNNRLIARTLRNDLFVGRDWSKARTVMAATGRQRGTIEAVGIADPTPRTYSFERVPANSWLVIVGVPTSAIYGSASDWLSTTVWLVACALGLSVSMAYAATGHFTRPITSMVREALAIGRGDLSKRVDCEGGDELGLLARAFNQMADRLKLTHEHKQMVEHISESVRQSLDLNQILNTTVQELGSALRASRCCLAVIDERSSADLDDCKLVFDYTWINPSRGGTALKNRCIRVTGNSLLRIILEQGTVMSLDVIDDRDSPLFENTDTYPEDWRSIKSLIACPILTNRQPVGMILVHQCDSLRTWTDSEMELVSAVATHVALAMDHASLFERTKALAEQEQLINHIVRSVRGSLELDTILSTVTRELKEALSADLCQIAQPRPEGPLIVTHEFHDRDIPVSRGLSVYGQNLDFHPQAESQTGGRSVLGIDLRGLRGDSDAGSTLRDAPVAVIEDVTGDSRAEPFRDFLQATGTRSLVAAPLLDKDRLLGVLMVHQCTEARTWRANDVSLIAAIADQVAVAISHARLFAQVSHQAITDGLTGLYNHVYLKRRLTDELSRAHRRNSPLSLLMIDLDKLKQINDQHGHPVGDAAIRQVAWTLKNLLRSGDTAARYGGEEFGVILPDTPLAEAALIADRLCRQVNSRPLAGLGHISVSIGVASYPEQAGSTEELVKRADRALYEAKNQGRNRVCTFRLSASTDAEPEVARS